MRISDWSSDVCSSDLFHVMNGIGKTMKTSHGAYVVFMKRLRDAVFKVSAEDLAAEECKLRTGGMEEVELTSFKLANWGYFLDRCRRHIPERSSLLREFDLVCKNYSTMKDARTGEELFRQA